MALFGLPTVDHRDALTDTLTWADNPFVRRDARCDRKRHQPLRSYLWMCGVLLALGAVGLWALNQLSGLGLGNAWFIGGDHGTALCILLCGVHIYFIAGASQKHTTRMFQEEVSRTTLSSLLLLPSSPFQLVLQSMVYPWLVAMRAAVVLLPLYAVCVALGGVTWLDILLLYLVFALSAVTIPRWNRPALSETVAASVPTAEPVMQGTVRPTANAGTSQGWGGGFGFLFSLSCFLVFAVLVYSRARPAVAYEMAHRYAPDSILQLLPSSLLSWPLLLGRGLATPFDWFGYPVAPLPFTLILFLVGRYTQIVRVSEWLQVGLYRDLAFLRTYVARRRLEGALAIALVFVWTGYLWRWGIVDGGLSGLAGWTGPAGAPGLPGFLYGLLFVTLYWRGLTRVGALAEWIRPLPRNATLRAIPRFTPYSALSYLCSPLVFAACYYFACCLLARTSPLPVGIAPFGGKLIAVGFACWLLRFGLSYFARILIYVGMALPMSMQFLASLSGKTDLPPNLKLLTYLSPYMAFSNLGNHNLIGFDLRWALHSGFPWQNWLLYSGFPGLALTLLVGLLVAFGRSRAHRNARGERNERRFRAQTAEEDRPAGGNDIVMLDPTIVGKEAFLDVTVTHAAQQARTEAPLALAMIRACQTMYDNAVLTREIRTRLRGKLQNGALLRTFLIYLAITVALIYGAPQIAISFGRPMANVLFPSLVGAQAPECVLALWYLALFATVPFVGAGLLPAAFAAEYEKSTLGFTLTTPMSSWAIALGKAIGLLLTGSVGQVQLALWTLVLSVLLGAQFGLAHTLLVWALVVLNVAAVTMTIGLIALAVASLFPRKLTVKAGGIVQGLMFYTIFFAPSVLGYLRDWLTERMGMDVAGLWGVLLVGCGGLSALALIVTVYGVGRMRRTDVINGATRRDS
jgi:hypothetical protein